MPFLIYAALIRRSRLQRNCNGQIIIFKQTNTNFLLDLRSKFKGTFVNWELFKGTVLVNLNDPPFREASV